ncbi:DUF2806 domain-containing protein [Bradyrhizobium sp. BRP20]|uniref:DUF2806 domain-containing protein n=1 Tax=Bradyrhizobium sp. BRP20 TaxID=2793822 RepID=UPI001CD52AD3|nr:DUF2806 domain-containing protein [Bradyrhizobium sp. BRP20]MCA1433126.1 DUF2806 domain-containing protein [Bradyrhizobium sp. BRP20]
MANELESVDPAGGSGVLDKIKEVIGAVNLPKVIAGPAGEAISRLIAGGADIPAAWLEQKAKAIRNKTEGQALVSKTLAGAAAELVKNDPALVQRAADAFIAKEIRHQHNRETIALKAIEHLKETPEAQTSTLDDDWLNMYARHAQEASSDRMQDLWAKVLAGQLRTANSFSLQTLRFISELDEPTASLFEKWSARVMNGQLIPFPPREGLEFGELLRLEEAGLVSGTAGNLSNRIADEHLVTIKEDNLAFLQFRPVHLVLYARKPFSANIPCLVLTRVGRELYPITKGQTDVEVLKFLVQQLPKHNVLKLLALAIPGQAQSMELWKETSAQQ